jgi:hypothetical protein
MAPADGLPARRPGTSRANTATSGLARGPGCSWSRLETAPLRSPAGPNGAGQSAAARASAAAVAAAVSPGGVDSPYHDAVRGAWGGAGRGRVGLRAASEKRGRVGGPWGGRALGWGGVEGRAACGGLRVG